MVIVMKQVPQEANAFAAALNSSVTTTLNFGNTEYGAGHNHMGCDATHTAWGYTWYDVEPMVALCRRVVYAVCSSYPQRQHPTVL